MILADKIISLRKKTGWSQEELADQLGVTRQSVSKWEGAQSVPDINKIVQMSRLFGVTTDYLLKDELEEPEYSQYEPESSLRIVTMEEASAYLALRKAAAPKMALATFLCIISPICLILLAALSEESVFRVSENAAAGIGMCIMITLVAAGVALFLSCAAKARDFRFLEEEAFETEYGVTGMVKECSQKFSDAYSRLNIIGTTLCILSVIPLFLSICISGGSLIYIAAVCLLLLLVGVGCLAFVYAGVYNAALQKLLQEGDYTRKNKKSRKLSGTVSAVYWLAVTAIFLWYTFGKSGNGQMMYSWFIWAIAGVLFPAVLAVIRLIERKGGNE